MFELFICIFSVSHGYLRILFFAWLITNLLYSLDSDKDDTLKNLIKDDEILSRQMEFLVEYLKPNGKKIVWNILVYELVNNFIFLSNLSLYFFPGFNPVSNYAPKIFETQKCRQLVVFWFWWNYQSITSCHHMSCKSWLCYAIIFSIQWNKVSSCVFTYEKIMGKTEWKKLTWLGIF